MQESLFILYDYLGAKRVKVGLFHNKKKQFGKQENNTSWLCPCARRMVWCAGAHEATPHMRIMQFSTLFPVFFLSCNVL